LQILGTMINTKKRIRIISILENRKQERQGVQMNRKKLFIILVMLSLTLLLSGCSILRLFVMDEKNHAPDITEELQRDNAEPMAGLSGETAEMVAEPETQPVSEAESLTEAEIPVTDDSSLEIEATQDGELYKPSVSLIMVGDMLMHTPVENSALQEDGSYDFSAIFEHTKELIAGADLALVNEEVIIGGKELGISGYPAFNAPYELGHELVEVGFDVICHGTNHALDKGKKGLINCLDFWETNYPEIAALGVHDSQESKDSIYLYEQDGITLAILNYTYGTNGIPLPESMPYAVDLLEEERVVEDIMKAEELADFTIVCPHWGTEYLLETDSQQQKWTKIFLENGVDLVLGTHPHVIEPIEWIRDEETGHEMLVYYSLGNFVNWTSSSGDGIANRMVGGMARLTLEKDEADCVYIAEYGVEPLVCHLQQGINGVSVYLLDDYTEELASQNEITKQDPDFSLEYCEELCEKVWDTNK